MMDQQLTNRERQIAIMIAKGETAGVIAERCGISQKTYDTHRGHLIRKIGVRGSNASALILLYCLRQGWIHIREGEIRD